MDGKPNPPPNWLPVRWLPVIGLMMTTVAAWVVYFTVAFPHPWQARFLHIGCFLPWTFFWHATVRGAFAWRLPFWLTLLVPVLVSLGGEWIQGVIPAVGHDPEWRGVGASMVGVAGGWFLLWVCGRWIGNRGVLPR